MQEERSSQGMVGDAKVDPNDSTWIKPGHSKQQRSCLLRDESSFGLIRNDPVYESKKNKQLNSGPGKAAGCQPLPWRFTHRWRPRPDWMLHCSGHVGAAHKVHELQTAIINNRLQNMSALDLFVLFEVQTC